MSQSNEGKKLIEEIHKVQKTKRVETIQNSTPVLVIKGFWIFAEGVALITSSAYSIFEGYYAHLPLWGSYALMVSGVLVLVPAGILLGKCFRGVARG